MIPEPTPEDLLRDAEHDSAYGMQNSVCCYWIRRAVAAEKRIVELKAALQPFALLGKPEGKLLNFHDLREDTIVCMNSGDAITAGDCRRAAALLWEEV